MEQSLQSRPTAFKSAPARPKTSTAAAPQGGSLLPGPVRLVIQQPAAPPKRTQEPRPPQPQVKLEEGQKEVDVVLDSDDEPLSLMLEAAAKMPGEKKELPAKPAKATQVAASGKSKAPAHKADPAPKAAQAAARSRLKVPPKGPELPIHQKEREILQALNSSFVMIIEGSTGSGKSTQVPKFIFQAARRRGVHARIVVSQPRRVAARSLALKVAAELGEATVGQSVGYRIGGDPVHGEHIEFATVGYLLQMFSNNPTEFGNYTHIILDEVHERSAEADMLVMLVRLLAFGPFEGTRVIIMSATMQGTLFVNYFGRTGPPTQVSVGGGRWSLDTLFLDEMAASLSLSYRATLEIQQRIEELFPPVRALAGNSKLDRQHCDKLHKIIIDAIKRIEELEDVSSPAPRPGITILVFLPGLTDISNLWATAKDDSILPCERFKILPLHSSIPREDQELVFAEPPVSCVHVVLATNLAESSITLPNVAAVIDAGLHRRQEAGLHVTKWISKSSAVQRAGRAGRTRPGRCLRLYTKEFYQRNMSDFEPAQSSAIPLGELYLQARQVSEKLRQPEAFPGGMGMQPQSYQAMELLQDLLEVPDMKSIVDARRRTAELGLISSPSEEGWITALGYFCLHLPLPHLLARLVWMGVHFGLAADGIVLASVLSCQDAFSAPAPIFTVDENEFLEKLQYSCGSRLLYDGGMLSEPLMHRQLFMEWLHRVYEAEHWDTQPGLTLVQKCRKETLDFSDQYSLQPGRLAAIVDTVVDLALRTWRLCDGSSTAQAVLGRLLQLLGYSVQNGDLIPLQAQDAQEFSLKGVFSCDMAYLKGLLAAAFSDNLFLGTYSGAKSNPSLQRSKDAAAQAEAKRQAQIAALEHYGMETRRTVVITDRKSVKDLQLYVSRVTRRNCTGTRSSAEEAFVTLHEKEDRPETARWTGKLTTRSCCPLLESPRRLSPDINLLLSFEKSMRDLQKQSPSLRGWTLGLVPVDHPYLLQWEAVHSTSKECAGSAVFFERRNAVGAIGYIPPPKEKAAQVALFAVSATVSGLFGRFPQGVTVLAPGHLAFVIATVGMDLSGGKARLGFSKEGWLAVRHRFVQLPDECLDAARWEKIEALRSALRSQLQVFGSIRDSDCAIAAHALLEAVPHQDEAPQARLQVGRAFPDAVVSMAQEANQTEHLSSTSAFLPLAAWSTIVSRRDARTHGSHPAYSADKARHSQKGGGTSQGLDRFARLPVPPPPPSKPRQELGPQEVRLHSLRFTQDSVNSKFRDGRSTSQTIEDLKSGLLQVSDLPMIRVVQAFESGFLFSLDNRRLRCMQMALPDPNTTIKVLIVSDKDPKVKEELNAKFTTGCSVVQRGAEATSSGHSPRTQDHRKRSRPNEHGDAQDWDWPRSEVPSKRARRQRRRAAKKAQGNDEWVQDYDAGEQAEGEAWQAMCSEEMADEDERDEHDWGGEDVAFPEPLEAADDGIWDVDAWQWQPKSSDGSVSWLNSETGEIQGEPP